MGVAGEKQGGIDKISQFSLGLATIGVSRTVRRSSYRELEAFCLAISKTNGPDWR